MQRSATVLRLSERQTVSFYHGPLCAFWHTPITHCASVLLCCCCCGRELHEELGIPLEQASTGLNKLSIFPYQDRWCQVFGCAFTYRHDRSTSQGRDFSLQAEEVEWVRWVPLTQVADMLSSDEQFTPVGRHILQLHQQQLLPK